MKNLKILNSKAIQEDFWGNGAIYHGYAGMPDDSGRVYSEELCVLEAERAAKMKLKIAAIKHNICTKAVPLRSVLKRITSS